MAAKAWMGLAAGCALLGAALLLAPLSWTHPDDVLTLEPGAVAAETGHAFLVPLAVDRESDRDGVSDLRLFEDGRPLGPAHAVHAVVRAAGLGAFSHWGDALYFSASDNSDPRTNGRRYEARWPQRATAGVALPGLLLVALAALLALSAALVTLRARPALVVHARGDVAPPPRDATRGARWWAWSLALAILTGGVLLAHAAFRAQVARERLAALQASFLPPPEGAVAAPAIDRAPSAAPTASGAPPSVASAVPAVPAAPAAPAVPAALGAPAARVPSAVPAAPGLSSHVLPRTLRLLDTPDALEFRATGEPLARRPPVPVPFPASVALAPGAEVACTAPLDLREEDLAELRLTLRVRQGKRLLLHFTMREQGAAGEPNAGDGAASVDARRAREFHAALEVPLTPSDDWQTLRLAEPLVLAGQQDWIGRDVHFTGLTLSNPAETGAELQLELRDVELSGAGAFFAQATHGSGRLGVGDDLRLACWQSCAGETGVPLPPEAAGRRLTGAVALLDPEGRGGAASYRVELEDGRGGRRTLVEGALDAAQGWTDLQVDLPAGTPAARLVFGSDNLPAGVVLAWSSLRCVDLARPAQRVVLVLIDTLRADATGCCGGAARDATPVMDALAAQGARFTRCYSQASWTRPSMPSLFTGRYVAATGVQLLGQRLPARYGTLAESFAAAGFHTLAFLTNTNAGPAAGLDQGFDEVLLERERALLDDTAPFLERRVSPRLAQLPDDDLFVSVHLMEVHEPFGPAARPPDWRVPQGAPVTADVHLDRSWVLAPTDASRRQLYALDVSRTDRALGSFLDRWLGTWEGGSGQPVTLALASDHGEFLGEGGRWGHGWGPMLEPVLHVPLVLRAPGRIASGAVCDEIVQNVDIGVTLLQLAGVPDTSGDEGGRAGRSLLPLLLEGRRDGPESALAGLESGASREFTVITPEELLAGENGRMLVTRSGGVASLSAPARELSAADVLLAREPDFSRAWDGYLASQRAWRRHLWDGSGSEPVVMDPAALEQLKALGYLGR